ncbi:MAG TPA: NUDIX domain-containing protein, partial [Oceanithermus sp.]|nr:NUDIX domain-containing protein [Oceanithermus sp.]
MGRGGLQGPPRGRGGVRLGERARAPRRLRGHRLRLPPLSRKARLVQGRLPRGGALALGRGRPGPARLRLLQQHRPRPRAEERPYLPEASVPVLREHSAGGVLLEDGKVLLIRTRNLKGEEVWTFPKGLVEPGESPERAALREVFEETGYEAEILRPLGQVTYWFVRDG